VRHLLSVFGVQRHGGDAGETVFPHRNKAALGSCLRAKRQQLLKPSVACLQRKRRCAAGKLVASVRTGPIAASSLDSLPWTRMRRCMRGSSCW
jgi:hypothetical protein